MKYFSSSTSCVILFHIFGRDFVIDSILHAQIVTACLLGILLWKFFMVAIPRFTDEQRVGGGRQPWLTLPRVPVRQL